MSDFMSDRTLSMTVKSIPSEPMTEGDDDWDHNSWSVTLAFQGRTMETKFHTGFGIVGEPTIGAVLSSLASDASSAINATSFEDWAGDYGYDTDSRKAERTYKAVCDQVEKLRELLDEDFLHVLAFEAPNGGDWSEFKGTSIELPDPSGAGR